jgi:hypothetical protein
MIDEKQFSRRFKIGFASIFLTIFSSLYLLATCSEQRCVKKLENDIRVCADYNNDGQISPDERNFFLTRACEGKTIYGSIIHVDPIKGPYYAGTNQRARNSDVLGLVEDYLRSGCESTGNTQTEQAKTLVNRLSD